MVPPPPVLAALTAATSPAPQPPIPEHGTAAPVPAIAAPAGSPAKATKAPAAALSISLLVCIMSTDARSIRPVIPPVHRPLVHRRYSRFAERRHPSYPALATDHLRLPLPPASCHY